jgi:hypothetical protein
LLDRAKRHLPKFEIASGTLLAAMGLLFITGNQAAILNPATASANHSAAAPETPPTAPPCAVPASLRNHRHWFIHRRIVNAFSPHPARSDMNHDAPLACSFDSNCPDGCHDCGHGLFASSFGVELRETLVPAMDPAGLESATTETIRSLEGDVVGLSVLGVGAGTAKLTIDEHRAVDVQLNAAFARGLKASGRVKHLAFMSAVGADPTAAASGSGAAGMARYARVKGEAEAAVKESGPAVVSIFRPAMIIGSQHTPWLLEKVLPVFSFVTPAKYKSITVAQIAKAMIATSLNTPAKSDVYHYAEMMALNRSLP